MPNGLEHHFRYPQLAVHKDKLDTANSLTWFLMDATWMTGLYPVAFLLAPIVFITGLALTVIDRRPAHTAINLALMSWILMNVSWMYSDIGDRAHWLAIARVFFGLGGLALAAAIFLSKNLRETFSHFRRFRLKDYI